MQKFEEIKKNETSATKVAGGSGCLLQLGSLATVLMGYNQGNDSTLWVGLGIFSVGCLVHGIRGALVTNFGEDLKKK